MPLKDLKKGILFLAVLETLVFLTVPVHASSSTATSNVPGYRLSVGYTGYSFHYKEDTTPSDKDTAWMNGVFITGETISKHRLSLGHFYNFTRIAFSESNGRYNGYLQTGTGVYLPITSDTNEKILRVDAGTGFAQIQKHLVTKESLVLGIRFWKRKLEGIGGYTEDYRNLFLGLKFETDYYFSKHFSTGISALGAVSPKAKSINFMYNEKFDTVFPMGTAYTWTLTLPIKYKIGHLTLGVEGFYTGWKFHKSEKKTVVTSSGTYTMWEPSSRTEETGINLEFSLRF